MGQSPVNQRMFDALRMRIERTLGIKKQAQRDLELATVAAVSAAADYHSAVNAFEDFLAVHFPS